MRLRELFETALGSTTSSGNVAQLINPQVALGTPTSSYTGSPGKSGTKAPKPPKVKMQKPTDNALDSNKNIFGSGTAIKR